MSYFDENEAYIINEKPRFRDRTPPQRKRPLFTRGYQESRERLSKNPYYTRSCFNCAYYYQASGDKEEVCQNPDVLQFDMVVTDNNIYCVKWKPISLNKTEQKSLFKKNGRSQLD